MIKQTFLYPIAAAINFFSITVLLIIAGLLGKGELAADIGVLQGALVAVFFSLSGNARSLVLAGSTFPDEINLFYFRILLVFPAVIVVLALVLTVVDVPTGLLVGLILRKCSEWIAELQLAHQEKKKDFRFVCRYIQINTVGLLVLIFSLILSWTDAFYIVLFVWATLPAWLLLTYIRWVLGFEKIAVDFSRLIPHLGSSAVIGMTTYLFRILLIMLAGKEIAGQMITAYAIGGTVSSLYTYALGPSLLYASANTGSEGQGLYLYILFCSLVGSLVISAAIYSDVVLVSPLFVFGVGFSLIGGGVMLFAQRQRLYLMQLLEKEVFVPDALVNILLVASIPFAYYIFGMHSLAVLFLWAAMLNALFYMSLAFKSRIRLL